MKQKKQSGTVARFAKQLLIGGTIGGVLGGVVGFTVATFNIDKNGLPFSQESVIVTLTLVLRVVYLLALLLSILCIYQVLKDYKRYQNMDDDDSEELYRAMNRKHSYATVFNGVATSVAMVSLVLSFKVTFASDKAELFFPIFDFVFVVAGSVFQTYILKVYSRIRDIKMPLVPTLKELKANVMQMDEAELEANYKMSFDIVMNLNGAILPAIYLILFFWSFITQKVEVTGILVAAVIHLYIMVMQFKMTKAYYK
ncbi:DUF3169 family protein [Streptococcus ratti]|uniref:Membrane protein n=1 Tax=Streptococcus ratti FA-1 = DSM 20564 TaxID=699248 RepID=A0ABP2QZ34_STRRT|nr:DUF3169 family protein [Streptococcus ratti]EJN94305.1 membrane protein [Streptococcus ratti FA-1 = DSM 20564]EMP70919.1 membrane protein [Streptococcus ratti FA-1 = DSM 20564]QEY06258.1 DUF3169 family protein [Streptococcus ratti]VEI60598.1 membrane protein [Streptococcus mutans]